MASSLLVVDDDDGIRSVFEREGFRVTVAGNGERALDLLRRTPVDCILLDAGPPGLEGLEVCRRRRERGDQLLRLSDLVVDRLSLEVSRGGRRIDLTRREFELLLAFMHRPRQVLRREELLARVWGYDFSTDTNVVEVYVLYLRRKLEAGGESRLLHTVRGAGYVLRDG
jgi:DNA-binding response OmpR family regulator